MAYVRKHPGLTLSDLVEHLSCGWGSVYLHLRRLEDADLLRVERVGGRSLLFPRGGGAREWADQTALLRGESAHAIARAICDVPGCDILGLSDLVGLTPRTVYYHVRRLVAAGLVESSSSTRHRDLQPSDLLRSLLADDAG